MKNTFKENCHTGINLTNLNHLLTLKSDELLRVLLVLGGINFKYDDRDVIAYLESGILDGNRNFPYLVRWFSKEGMLFTMRYCSEDTLVRIINITTTSYSSTRDNTKAREIITSVLETLSGMYTDMRTEVVIHTCIRFDVMNYDPELMKRLDEHSGLERHIMETKLKDNSKFEKYREHCYERK